MSIKYPATVSIHTDCQTCDRSGYMVKFTYYEEPIDLPSWLTTYATDSGRRQYARGELGDVLTVCASCLGTGSQATEVSTPNPDAYFKIKGIDLQHILDCVDKLDDIATTYNKDNLDYTIRRLKSWLGFSKVGI